MKLTRLILAFFILSNFSAYSNLKSISKKAKEMKKFPGFYTFYWEKKSGKIWIEIDKINSEFLYINSLPAGLGSNNIGLDRNQLGRTHIVKFQRFGPKIFLMQPNYAFRAISDNPDERKAVEDSFAKSVIWGFRIESAENERILVDASSFLIRDALGIINRLKNSNQGNYTLDISRSAIYLPNTKNFPFNTEIETILTFTCKNPGDFVKMVSPDPRSITIRQRHSFIKLPDNNYKPRIYDPRSSYFSISYMDFSTPIEEPILKRFICRHRLKKKNPNAKISEPIKPLVYYVDRGTPEPIKSALIEGASWWNEAFEAIGYKNAFQVRVLPKGADPMDIRYNVINWVHRSTRGWSYGSSVIDPRTGEIIKGHISLGSLRIRQDFLIAEGLIACYEEGKKNVTKMLEMALARIQQLSCHEVGHTIGLSHNYASSVNDRASVMDYPHPLVKINQDGSINLDNSYTKGIGAWDKVSIAYGYQDFPDGSDEGKELKNTLNRAFSRGLYFLTDQDARTKGSAHPLAHLWDNGKHPTDELKRVMKIRSIALNQFSKKKIQLGAPMATLEEVLVPVYMYHRYQIEACSKVLGGLYYNHSLRGDKQKILKIAPPEEQRRSLDMLLLTIEPKNLAIREKILNMIPPRPPGYDKTPELFTGYTGPTFDPLGAAESITNITIKLILNPQRAARLIEYHSRNKIYPGFNEVLEKLISFSWKSHHKSGLLAEIQRVVNNVVLNNLMRLAINKKASSQVRAITLLKLNELKEWLIRQTKSIKNKNQKAHYFYGILTIKHFQKDPYSMKIYLPSPPPKGPPIGMKN